MTGSVGSPKLALNNAVVFEVGVTMPSSGRQSPSLAGYPLSSSRTVCRALLRGDGVLSVLLIGQIGRAGPGSRCEDKLNDRGFDKIMGRTHEVEERKSMVGVVDLWVCGKSVKASLIANNPGIAQAADWKGTLQIIGREGRSPSVAK